MSSSSGGQCAMRGSCGSKSIFTPPLPCPYNGPPVEPEDDAARQLLVDICGPEYTEGPACCDSGQLESLKKNLGLAENLIASCPACKNNFRNFYCTFTCSPDQGSFLNITETQKTTTGQTAVKSVDFFVGQRFGEGFYDSCKSVQVGAANMYAMELIGGGAQNYSAFLEYMGEVKEFGGLGSPFQINYPSFAPPEYSALDIHPRNCADNDLASRCTCIDCPDVCQTLPYVPPPGSEPTCHVGAISCLSFVLILGYGIAIVAFLLGYVLQLSIRRRRERKQATLDTDSFAPVSPRSHPRGLVGAGSLARSNGSRDDNTFESRDLGRGVMLLDPIENAQPRQYLLNTVLRRFFYRLGSFAASSPYLNIALILTLFGFLNIGWKNFAVETEPVRLWVAPQSESRLQKEFFDEHFGPFYRPQQIFITSADEHERTLTYDHVKYWMDAEADIRALKSQTNGITFDDVCFKPGGEEDACVIQSIGAWFGNDFSQYGRDDWADCLLNCARYPADCLPDFQQPLIPQMVLGVVPEDNEGHKDFINAKAIVVTYVVSDSLDQEVQSRAMEWEATLLDYLKDLSARSVEDSGIKLAFSTGVSLEEELNKSTNMDIKIVVLSYVAMFLYVSLTLGAGSHSSGDETLSSSLRRWARNFPKLFRSRSSSTAVSVDQLETPSIFPRLPSSLFTNSKVTLGFFGIALVILSVSTSVGFFSIFFVKVTLIIAEVIPFLVLAVGVDNVFILVHELDRQNALHGPNASTSPGSTQGANTFQTPLSPTTSVDPYTASSSTATHRGGSGDESVDAASMPTYLSAEERVARTLAKMGPSILLSTITETVAFALGALVPMPAVRNFALYAAGSVFLNALLQVTVFVSAMLIDLKRQEANRVDCFPFIKLQKRIMLSDGSRTGTGISRIARFIKNYYGPFLLKPVVKGLVLLVFIGIFVASVISIQYTQLGLDQKLALPDNSYLIDYFDALSNYLDIGPPVYFVVSGTNVTSRSAQQTLCGRFTTCQDFSLANVLEAERKREESSFIAEPTASWIDDFLAWLDPAKEECCRVKKRDPSQFCSERDSPRRCRPCFEGREPAWNITMEGFPEDGEFMRYLNQWLVSPTTQDCPLAGRASFGEALSLDNNRSTVLASHFRTYHTPLKTQDDFINAFAAAHRIADDLSQQTGAEVFPYSLFYVFFDQYAHIISIAQEVLGLGLASVLIVTSLMLGSWRTGTIVTGVVALTVVTVMGVMAAWGISLNAVSLVNLVISLGISVEFCAHIARAFMNAPGLAYGMPADHPAGQKERDERTWVALVDVGPSVLSGITFTKLIGICVLAFTRSRLLEIYYFRMWLTLIISGALHGLVLLPVVLSLAGGPGFPTQEADEEWMATAVRHEYEYAPFLAEDETASSN